MKIHCVAIENRNSGVVNWYVNPLEAENAYNKVVADPLHSSDTVARFDVDVDAKTSAQDRTGYADGLMWHKDYTPLQIRVGTDGYNAELAQNVDPSAALAGDICCVKSFQDPKSGLVWNVRFVPEGGKYGVDLCLTHDDENPLIEFYDNRYPHTEFGQFVSRYYLETLLDRKHPVNAGIMLDPEPSWSLSGACLGEVLSWAKSVRSDDLLKQLLACFNEQQEMEGFTVSDDSDEIYQAHSANDALFQVWLFDCRLSEALEYKELTS